MRHHLWMVVPPKFRPSFARLTQCQALDEPNAYGWSAACGRYRWHPGDHLFGRMSIVFVADEGLT